MHASLQQRVAFTDLCLCLSKRFKLSCFINPVDWSACTLGEIAGLDRDSLFLLSVPD